MSAVPPLAPGAVPERVRAAGPQAVAEFRAALGFEEVLLDNLLSAALPEEEGGPRAASVAATMTDAIVAAGGAGIATAIVTPPGPDR